MKAVKTHFKKIGKKFGTTVNMEDFSDVFALCSYRKVMLMSPQFFFSVCIASTD